MTSPNMRIIEWNLTLHSINTIYLWLFLKGKGHERNQGMAIPVHVGISFFYLQQTCRFVKPLSYVCMHQNSLVWCNMFYETISSTKPQQDYELLFVHIQSESAWNGITEAASTIFIGHLSCFTPSGFLCYICIFFLVFFIAFFTNFYLFPFSHGRH